MDNKNTNIFEKVKEAMDDCDDELLNVLQPATDDDKKEISSAMNIAEDIIKGMKLDGAIRVLNRRQIEINELLNSPEEKEKPGPEAIIEMKREWFSCRKASVVLKVMEELIDFISIPVKDDMKIVKDERGK